jgi:Flp pilus assembly pilin Flp
MTNVERLTKFLRDRDDIGVYEYLLLAALIAVGAVVGIVEYIL